MPRYTRAVRKTRKLKVRCPCCSASLDVDAATGKVLAHQAPEAPLAGGKDFESLLADLDKQKEHAEEVFEQEVAALEDHDRILEEKFKEAFKRAAASPDDEPPPSPFDLD